MRRAPVARILTSVGTSVCAALLLAAPCAAQAVRSLKYDPIVLASGPTAPLRLEVEVTGDPTSVTVDFSPAGTVQTSIAMRDDGAGGDRIAGDSTFTAELPSAPILAARTADDVNRVFVGFLNIFAGSIRVLRGNLFVDVYSRDAGSYPIVRPDQFLQATTRLVNIHDPTYFLTGDATHVTREFYRWFGDDYDVINLIYQPQRFANRTHTVVQNTVAGIGRPFADDSAAFGSAGRLTGISQFPIPGLFDGAETGHIHELGHQWINYLGVYPLATGIPHWPKSTMATGVMGFSIGGQGGQGGSFSCDIVDEGNDTLRLNPRAGAPAYNDLDLYLMGLLPPDQVRTQIVFADQAAVAQLSCSGQAFTGPVVRIGADEIVRQLGPRTPPAGVAPNRFRIATILVTRDALATPEAMWLYSWFVDRAELTAPVPTHSGFVKETGRPFALATGGRGTLDMRIEFDEAPADFALTPASGVREVDTGGPATFEIAVEPRGAPFEQDVALRCGTLPAGYACEFSPPVARPGSEGVAVTLTVSTAATTLTAFEAGSGRGTTTGAVWVAVMLMIASVLSTRRARQRTALVSAAAAVSVALAVAVGCNGDRPRPPDIPAPAPSPQPPTPARTTITHPIVVIGAADGIEHSTVVAVTVPGPS
jgi:hypothetical protein